MHGMSSPEWGKAGEAKVENAPRPGHVGADGGIHEAGEERHTAPADEGILRVTPGADFTRSLE